MLDWRDMTEHPMAFIALRQKVPSSAITPCMVHGGLLALRATQSMSLTPAKESSLPTPPPMRGAFTSSLYETCPTLPTRGIYYVTKLDISTFTTA